jgi:hypothetical protein
LVLRLVTPGASLRSPALFLAVVPALLAAGVVAELLCVQQNLWGERMIGANAAFCLLSIPCLAAAPLTGTLLALRQGAPENPGLAGAAAGLFAGAIGAALYATHCPDDSPLFVAAWYSLAICFVVIAGALVGRPTGYAMVLLVPWQTGPGQFEVLADRDRISGPLSRLQPADPVA